MSIINFNNTNNNGDNSDNNNNNNISDIIQQSMNNNDYFIDNIEGIINGISANLREWINNGLIDLLFVIIIYLYLSISQNLCFSVILFIYLSLLS